VLNRGPLDTTMMSVGALEILLTQLAETIEDGVEGDVVEMGCWQGTTSVLLRSFLDAAGSDKVFHVFDSFEGLPPTGPHDHGVRDLERPFFVAPVDVLVQRFRAAGLRPPIIHVGWFGEIPQTEMPERIAFAFLDGDLYESIRDSLLRVLPVLAPRGRVVVDDWGWRVTPGVEEACRDVLAEAPGFRLSILDGYKADVVPAEECENREGKHSCGALIVAPA
jgi:O-methyltransferase